MAKLDDLLSSLADTAPATSIYDLSLSYTDTVGNKVRVTANGTSAPVTSITPSGPTVQQKFNTLAAGSNGRLSADDFNRTIKRKGGCVTIVDINPANRLFPIIVKDARGARHNWSIARFYDRVKNR